jgi:general nucleoside transport system ATP-binding protein
MIIGEDMTNKPPKKITEKGVGHIPEDRMGTGLIMNFTVAENLILGSQSEAPFVNRWFLPLNKKWFLDKKEINKHADQLIKEYNIKTPSRDVPARTLSGGNLQKLILAREMSRKPKFLIANQPTRGLDVGATEFIQSKLEEEKEKGTAILLISEDLDEILSLSDRIAVFYEGHIAGIVPAEQANIKDIGLMMAGVKKSGEKPSK